MELLPAIDLRNARAVRLRQGDFAAETRYATTPARLLRRYAAAGASRVHVVDLDGARRGVAGNTAAIRELAALKLVKLQVGGGVRRMADVVRLLDAGAERVVAGSAAIETPELVADWIRRFGAHRIVAALDVRVQDDGMPRVWSHGWQQPSKQSLWDVAARLARFGLKHALCTDIARDGTATGPNLGLYRECTKRFPSIAWQASGGIRNGADLRALAATHVAAAISGKALVENSIPKRELLPFLRTA
jgi:phosphoribosylformimino-5-aminoimidazole carboxamide ribotide isomerase